MTRRPACMVLPVALPSAARQVASAVVLATAVLLSAPPRARAAQSGAVGAAVPSTQMPGTQAPPPLGRLFFTPAQRATLDRAHADLRGAASGDPASGDDAAASGARRVDGLVRRSAGPATVWVDGTPTIVDPRGRPDGPTLDGDRVVVRAADGRMLRLRPGDDGVRP
jgi:hypothetical protein